MDFMNRSGQSSQPGRVAPTGPVPTAQNTPQTSHHNLSNMPAGDGGKNHNHKQFVFGRLSNWLRVANVVLLFSVTILGVSVVLLLRNGTATESQYINTSNYQAIFLSNGQVYFGKVAHITTKYIDLRDIFYLNSSSTSTDATKAAATTTTAATNNYSLVKLGCELHGPDDQMIINSDQVTFMENLTSKGQVTKTITAWQKANPKGQVCSDTTNSTSQSTTSNSAKSPQASTTTKP